MTKWKFSVGCGQYPDSLSPTGAGKQGIHFVDNDHASTDEIQQVSNDVPHLTDIHGARV
jgi:hypothetical protein